MQKVSRLARERHPSKVAKMPIFALGMIALLLILPGQALAQGLGRYSASGTHQCGEHSPSCVVTGLGYRDCIEATSTLRSQDCCLTRRDGSRSSGFVLNYCIPETGPGR